MAVFSATSAFAAGFKMIGRFPAAPLVWGALVAVVFLPIQVMQLMVFWPSTLKMYGQALEASRAGHALNPAAMQQPPGMLMLSLLIFPLILLVWAVVAAAGTRAIISPEDRRFFFLRLGRRELWLTLVLLVQGMLFYVTILVMALVLAVISAVLIATAAATHVAAIMVVGAVVGIGGGIAGALSILYLLMRFSLAGPMTIHDGEFRLFESWKLTKGHGWKLVGLALLVTFSMLVFELLFFGLAAVVGAAFGLGHLDRLQEALLTPDTWLNQAMPVIIVGMGVFTVVGGYFWALMVTPWADAYQQIAGPKNLDEIF